MVGKLRIAALFVVLTALAMVFMGQTPLKTLIINSSGDSYVVTDIADDADPQGFRDTNYGSLEFLKTWYAWGVIADERLLSIDLVMFDLTELEDLDIESVSLQLFARQVTLTEAARLVDIHLVQDPWNEDTVTFNTRPAWDQPLVATAASAAAGEWYASHVAGASTAAAHDAALVYVGRRHYRRSRHQRQSRRPHDRRRHRRRTRRRLHGRCRCHHRQSPAARD